MGFFQVKFPFYPLKKPELALSDEDKANLFGTHLSQIFLSHSDLIPESSHLRRIWTYGDQIWGCAKPSQIRTIQAFQFISLRMITGALGCVSKNSLHNYLNISTVNSIASIHYKRFYSKTQYSSNPLLAALDNTNIVSKDVGVVAF